MVCTANCLIYADQQVLGPFLVGHWSCPCFVKDQLLCVTGDHSVLGVSAASKKQQTLLLVL